MEQFHRAPTRDRARGHGGVPDAGCRRRLLLPRVDQRRRAQSRALSRASVDGPRARPRRGAGRRARGRDPRHEARRRLRLDGDPARARMDRRVAVPIEAFPGVMGTALDEAGRHSTMPPRKNGGNMDIKQLTRGATLYLPVWVPGALFSVGDGHAAQGDGEVCVTAVEMRGQPTLRFGLQKGRRLEEPQLRTTRPLAAGTNTAPWFATTAHGPDLFAAAQRAVRHMIDHLVRERGFSREEAYIVCSVAADLKISEIVDAPNWIVSAFMPDSIFV